MWIDRCDDGTFKINDGLVAGVTGNWESTALEKVVDNLGMYDNGTTTYPAELDEDKVRVIPTKIIVIKTWAGELAIVEELGQVR